MKKYKLSRNLIENARFRLVEREKILLSHNVYPYYKVAKSFNEGNDKVAVVHAVGTGKSFIAIQWLRDELKGAIVSSHKVEEKPIAVHPQGKVKALYLAPKLAVFDQVERQVKDLAIPELSNHIEFMTYSGLLSKFKKSSAMFNSDDEFVLSEEEFLNFEEYVGQFTHVILDEFHHADENKWGNAVGEAISLTSAKVLGLTATPIRSTGTNTVDTIFDGNVVSTISLADAIVDGILPFPIYQSSIYSYNQLLENYENKIQKIKNEEKRAVATQEINKIKKLILTSKNTEDTIIENFKLRKDGKFIVFCDDIATSEQYQADMLNIIEKSGLDLKIVYNVNSSNPKSLKQIDEFDKAQGKGLKLLFAVDMLNESVHVKDVDGVIMLRDTKSFIVYVQQLGRALSAGKQNSPLVLDLVNNINSSFEYREDYEEIAKVFRDVATRTTNPQIKNLALKTIQENQIMKKFDELDEMIGVKRVTEALKIEILTDMKNHGINLNKIYESDNEAFYSFQGEEYSLISIARWIKRAKEGVCSEDFVNALKKLGVDFSEKIISPKRKIEILKQAIEENAEGIKTLNGKVKIKLKCVFNGYPIGAWIGYVKEGRSKELGLKEEMEKLNIDLSRSVPTIEEKIEVIKEAISNDVYGIIKQDDGTMRIIRSCIYDGNPIGMWVYRAKQGKVKDEFIIALKKLNIDLMAIVNFTPEEKLQIIEEAIKNKCVGIEKLKNGTYRIYNTAIYDGHKIGIWISNVKQGQGNPEFVEGLIKLGVKIEKERLTVEDKLKIIEEAISNGVDGIQFKENGKIHIGIPVVYKNNPIGGWISRVKSGLTTDKEFVEGLMQLNIDLQREKRLSTQEKISILKEAIENKAEKISQKEDGTIMIGEHCEYKGYQIGVWIRNVKNGYVKDVKFIEVLKKLKVNIEKVSYSKTERSTDGANSVD